MLAAIFAGGDPNAGINWLQMGALWFNLFVLLWLLPKIIRGLTGMSPGEHLVAQRKQLKEELAAAKAKTEEAEAKLAKYVKKLDNLEKEVQQIVESYEQQGEADKQRLTEDADKAVDRLVREADFTIRQEALKAQREIRAAAVKTTLEMAEALVLERITDSDQRRLADEYIGSVESNANGV